MNIVELVQSLISKYNAIIIGSMVGKEQEEKLSELREIAKECNKKSKLNFKISGSDAELLESIKSWLDGNII